MLEIRVSGGDDVKKGDTLLVLEAMKMEHHITAPSDGHIDDIFVTPGSQVTNGQRLLEFTAADVGAENGVTP